LFVQLQGENEEIVRAIAFIRGKMVEVEVVEYEQ